MVVAGVLMLSACDGDETQTNLDWAHEFCTLLQESVVEFEALPPVDDPTKPDDIIAGGRGRAEALDDLADALEVLVPAKGTREFQAEAVVAFRAAAEITREFVLLWEFREEELVNSVDAQRDLERSSEAARTAFDQLAATSFPVALRIAVSDTPACDPSG